MNPRRVVILTRRFWPLMGDAESALVELATGLADAHMPTTVVTPCWQRSWPVEFMFENVRVVRLPRPAPSAWGQWNYVRRLTKWLRAQSPLFDVALAPSSEEVAGSVITALRRLGIPLIAIGAPHDGETRFHAKQQVAHAIVVGFDDEAILAEQAGYLPEQIHCIAPGVDVRQNREQINRSAARVALGKALGDHSLGTYSPLVVCFSRLDNSPGLQMLINAWRTIVMHWPDARLWILGQGTQRAALVEHVEACGLTSRVLLPGVVESIDELLCAANLMVCVESTANDLQSLLSAMAAGLPVVASDDPVHRFVLDNNQHGLLFPAQDEQQCAGSIARLLEQPTLADILGRNARQRIVDTFSRRQRVEGFQNVIQSLLATKQTGQQ